MLMSATYYFHAYEKDILVHKNNNKTFLQCIANNFFRHTCMCIMFYFRTYTR